MIFEIASLICLGRVFNFFFTDLFYFDTKVLSVLLAPFRLALNERKDNLHNKVELRKKKKNLIVKIVRAFKIKLRKPVFNRTY